MAAVVLLQVGTMCMCMCMYMYMGITTSIILYCNETFTLQWSPLGKLAIIGCNSKVVVQ